MTDEAGVITRGVTLTKPGPDGTTEVRVQHTGERRGAPNVSPRPPPRCGRGAMEKELDA